jgi:hypothetical protein
LLPPGPSYTAVATAAVTLLHDGFGSGGVLQTQLLRPQIRVRSSPVSRHDSDGPEHLRLVPTRDSCAAARMAIKNVHSITSSARASSDGGTVSPSVLAVLRSRARTWSAVRSGGLPAALPCEFGRLVLPLGESVPACWSLGPIATFQDLGCVHCVLDELQHASSGEMSRMEYSVKDATTCWQKDRAPPMVSPMKSRPKEKPKWHIPCTTRL